jgi:hypothetical protein
VSRVPAGWALAKLPKRGMKTSYVFKTVFSLAETAAGPLLRLSLGVVLFWIGCIHLLDPQPDVVLLSQSLPFLAFTIMVYLLGSLEIIAGILLLANRWVRYVTLLCLALFAGTLTIFVIAPAVTGFPGAHADGAVFTEGHRSRFGGDRVDGARCGAA